MKNDPIRFNCQASTTFRRGVKRQTTEQISAFYPKLTYSPPRKKTIYDVRSYESYDLSIQKQENTSVSQTMRKVTAIISSTFSSKLKLFSGTSGHFKVLVFLRILDNKGVLVNKRVLDSKRGLG